MNAIEVRDLEFFLDKRKFYGEKPLEFELKYGEILAVLGQNGVGKTTLIRLVLDFIAMQKGEIKIDGKNLKSLNQKELFSLVAYVPQAKNLQVGLSVVDMVLLGLNLNIMQMPKPSDIAKVENILEELEISHLRDKICSNLSGGEFQMVILARSLVKNPKIIVLDEPESNLDFKNQVKMLEILEKLREKNCAIMINTHYPQNAKKLATNVLFLSRDEYLFGKNETINPTNLSHFFEVDSSFFAGIC